VGEVKYIRISHSTTANELIYDVREQVSKKRWVNLTKHALRSLARMSRKGPSLVAIFVHVPAGIALESRAISCKYAKCQTIIIVPKTLMLAKSLKNDG
jgi:hypothetical protein